MKHFLTLLFYFTFKNETELKTVSPGIREKNEVTFAVLHER